MNNIFNIENLNKSLDGVAPVKDVSFAVSKHSIVLITGENGTGKTTLFNLITGLDKTTKGKITYNGNNIETKSALQISQLGIIRLYKQPRLFKNLFCLFMSPSALLYTKKCTLAPYRKILY